MQHAVDRYQPKQQQVLALDCISAVLYHAVRKRVPELRAYACVATDAEYC